MTTWRKHPGKAYGADTRHVPRDCVRSLKCDVVARHRYLYAHAMTLQAALSSASPLSAAESNRVYSSTERRGVIRALAYCHLSNSRVSGAALDLLEERLTYDELDSQAEFGTGVAHMHLSDNQMGYKPGIMTSSGAGAKNNRYSAPDELARAVGQPSRCSALKQLVDSI